MVDGERSNDQEKEAAMTCLRCEGLMVPERYQDLLDEAGQINFVAWHCLNCGNILDQVIVANREHRPEPTPHRHR